MRKYGYKDEPYSAHVILSTLWQINGETQEPKELQKPIQDWNKNWNQNKNQNSVLELETLFQKGSDPQV